MLTRRHVLFAAIAGVFLVSGCTGNSSGPHPARRATHSTSKVSGSTGSSSHPPVVAPADQAGSPWQISATASGGVAGFADRTSVLPGQSVRIFVSTTAATFVVHAFRMGWYRGVEGRLTWTSNPVAGKQQPAAVESAKATRTMTAPWTPSLTIATTGWEPGHYLLRLDTSSHHASFVPLTVRAASAAGTVVLISPVTTWQAYNLWGCCNLYEGGDGAFASRSRAVSFDRPYASNDGSSEFIDRELPVLAEAERLHLPLDFITDVDLEADPHVLDGARGVISMGHDEYWSPTMRAVVTAARDAGTNLAFLGANSVFRRIRFASTSVGPDRLEIDYKIASEDPLYGHDNSAVTADWPAAPGAAPESSLLGAQYGCFPGRTRVDGVIADPANWLFAGTHVTMGEHLTGLVGPETDAVQLGYPTPRPIEVLMHSPTQCPHNSPSHADVTYYVARSGAGVFDAGTIDWTCIVGSSCHGRASS
ncbi:MAG TPA: N,N-dimethylformamidase beta subunit family domain-containing protein, partial [Jatrophihabitantaceae bacterium]|nr:N,N-dimethylformamidase beta subunit family domain-containing protein [Jatrophihabitantaceae bacterium]